NGVPSGTCNNNPDACCQQDALGIPRCLLNATCSATGGGCTTSADCCNKLPCVNGVCQPACAPSNGTCTNNSDCCGGTCDRANQGSVKGTCSVPSCTPQTCAQIGATCGK